VSAEVFNPVDEVLFPGRVSDRFSEKKQQEENASNNSRTIRSRIMSTSAAFNIFFIIQEYPAD